jgi:hypothetical protein
MRESFVYLCIRGFGFVIEMEAHAAGLAFLVNRQTPG